RSLAAYRGMLIIPSFGARIKTALQMLTIGIILLFVYLKAMLVPLGYHWEMFESPTTIVVFDVLMVVNMVVTVLTGADYVIKHANLIKNVTR
ncbi:MAG TPA: hypothetical protein VM118_06560, partial [Acidobacteriota bacterium]|nr:hypothetical protein [Acidobacteriota bacterium]